MGAAIAARRHGLSVLVLDEQASPGGQIWRSVETAASERRDEILGSTYTEGRPVARAFRACGADYETGCQVWQIAPGFRVYVTRGGKAHAYDASAVILATGAQERPVPFPGWTLPGVLTVGAAQILLKTSSQIPDGPLWVAASGPLPLLYLTQLVRAGGRVAGYLDTTPPGRWKAALPHLPAAMRSMGDLLKGLKWQVMLRRSGVPVVHGVTDIAAFGSERLESVRYRTADGVEATVDAGTLLVHEGVVPSVHAPVSLGCAMEWSDQQECFAPKLDQWGETSVCDLFVAGDGAGIAGAKAAELRGELAALGVVLKLRDAGADVEREAAPIRRRLRKELAIRPFLDEFFRPRPQVMAPADDAIVCRCEEIDAGRIRALARSGRPGPNQIKTATRVGMGPCQGRQCGSVINRIVAAEQGRSPADVGLLHVRPPLKPVTIAELASLSFPPRQEEEKPSLAPGGSRGIN